MTVRNGVIRAMYRAVAPAGWVASPWLPPALHPGRRARRSMALIPDAAASADKLLARAMLASQWRTSLLQRYVRSLSTAGLNDFLDSSVRFEGAIGLERLIARQRPVIFATPHFGACVVGCLAAIRRLDGRRSLHLYFEANARNAAVAALCARAGAKAGTLLNGFAGAACALRVLQGGGFLAMMPDAFQHLADTTAVPFFGRLLRIAGGTAFLSQRSDALIVPTYITPEPGLAIRVRFSRPIDPQALPGGDQQQDRFALNYRLFKDIERQLRRTPEHWRGWESLPRISTPLELPRSRGTPDWESALAERCRQFPDLLLPSPDRA